MSLRQANSDREYIDEEEDHQEEIFGGAFGVDPMVNPVQFLPKYSQSRQIEPTCNEQCLSSCGSLCLLCSAPCGLCGCNCCCGYLLPTSYGMSFLTQWA